MAGEVCSRWCGYCGRCTDGPSQALCRECQDCGRRVWFEDGDTIPRRVLCARCERQQQARRAKVA